MSTAAIGTPVATGKLADDFAYWWNVAGEWVETPNRRRNGWSGVLRVSQRGGVVYVKRQCNHLCRTMSHPLGWPTASREWFFLQRLRRLGIRVPAPLFHGTRRTAVGIEAVLVTAELNGFASLAAQAVLTRTQRMRLADEVGQVLAVLHGARLQHSCLYDKHVMVRWQGDTPEVALLDLEKMRIRLTKHGAARHDLDQLWRHQRIWSADEWRLVAGRLPAAGRRPSILAPAGPLP